MVLLSGGLEAEECGRVSAARVASARLRPTEGRGAGVSGVTVLPQYNYILDLHLPLYRRLPWMIVETVSRFIER